MKVFSFLLAFVHLVFIENQGALIVPLTTKNMLADITLRITIHDKKNKGLRKVEVNGTTGEVIVSLEKDIIDYMFSNPISGHFASRDGIVKSSFGGMLPKLAYICLAWNLLFLIGLVYEMCAAGITDCTSGSYFALTWRMRSRTPYQAMVLVLLVPSTLLFVVFNVFLISSDGPRMFVNTMSNGLINFGAWVYGVLALREGYAPAFHWRSEEFENITFTRTLSTYFAPNASYARKLDAALIKVYRSGLKGVAESDTICQYVRHKEDIHILMKISGEGDSSESGEEEPVSPPTHLDKLLFGSD